MLHRPCHRPVRLAFHTGFRALAPTGRGGGLLAGFQLRGAGNKRPRVEAELRRLPVPAFPERLLVDVALLGTGHQRRALGEPLVPGRIAEPAFVHRRLDLGAPRRERLHDLARHTGDLEAPIGVRLLDRIAEPRQLPRQLAPVERADQHLGGVELFVGHGAPLAVLALNDIGQHGMGMKLRIEIARSVVGKRRGDHALAAGADHAARLRVLHPGLDGVVFDPGEGARYGPVVRGDDAPVAADQSRE